MESIIEIEINSEFHISQLPTTHIRKFALYIPTADQCIPTENNYFGLDELTFGNVIIDPEQGKLSMTLRQFFKDFLSSQPYAFEIACTPHNSISSETDIGAESLLFCKENMVSKNLIDAYLQLFLANKNKEKHLKAYRYGVLLKKLYRGIKTTEMNDEEAVVYSQIQKKRMAKADIGMTLASLDFDLQELESKCEKEELYPSIDMKYVNQFLVRTHKTYLNLR
jgi:hypothetical protein